MAKRSLQDRMNDMRPYFKAIEMYNEALIVKVQFPQKWKAYNSSDERIKVVPSETVANEMFYYASSEDSTYDDIFDLIEETIKANQDIILKIKLLKEKVEELRGIFSELSYDELKTLKFVTENTKTTKGRKKHTKKEKEPQKAENEEIEAIVTQSEEPILENETNEVESGETTNNDNE